MVPEDNDDVQIRYLASAISSLTLNLTSPTTLNNLDIEGDVVLFVSGTSFAAKNVSLVGGASYTTEIQVNGSDVTIRSLSLNSADFLSSYSTVTLDYVTVANVTSVAIVQTELYCGTCYLGDVTTCSLSTFSAGNVTLTSQQSNFTGLTNISNLSIELQVFFYNGYLQSVTIQENANLIAHGFLEMSQIDLMPGAAVLIANATQARMAPDPFSYVGGRGSFFIKFTDFFSFGNPDAIIDMTEVVVQLAEANNGSFTNIVFGPISVNAPGAVVLLSFTEVVFTQFAELYGNISVTGMDVKQSLTVLGPIVCKGGITEINAPVISSEFSQEGGSLDISQFLTVNPGTLINLTSLNFTVTDVSKITGDVLFTNSTAEILHSLSVIGNWESDNSTTIELPSLSPNCAPRLNVSGDLYIDSTINFALSETPSSKAEYPLFTYGAAIRGNFVSTFTVPNVTHGVFIVQYTNGAVTLVYTPHKKKFSGTKLYATIGGIAAFVLVAGVGAFLVRRCVVKRRQYQVIPN